MTDHDRLCGLLTEARDNLKHTRCRDDDASKCPACGIESQIDIMLTRLRAKEVVLVPVEPTVQ